MEEVHFFSALAEESSKTNQSLGQFFNGAARDRTIIFDHHLGCSEQHGCHRDCTFARMNFEEMSALNSAAQSGLEGSGTKPTIQIKLNEQENQVLSNVSLFFGMVTARRGTNPSLPKPLSALRMMTTGDEAGRGFWGPSWIWTKFHPRGRPSRSSARSSPGRPRQSFGCSATLRIWAAAEQHRWRSRRTRRGAHRLR